MKKSSVEAQEERATETSEGVKELWKTPEFEILGVEKTELQANPGSDGFGPSTLS